MRCYRMSDSKDDSGQNVKDKPFTRKGAYTETTRGKGARVLLIFFVIASIVKSIHAIIYQLANPSLGYIEKANAQQVAYSNGKIYLRTSGGTNGYQVYNNATCAEIGIRAKPGGNEFYKMYAKDNLVYGWTQASSTLWVDYWGGTGSTPVSTSISFGTNNTNCVASEGNYAYVGLGNGPIAIVKTTIAPTSVSLVNVTLSAGFESTQIIISGDHVYGCSGRTGGSHANVVNVSDSDL